MRRARASVAYVSDPGMRVDIQIQINPASMNEIWSKRKIARVSRDIGKAAEKSAKKSLEEANESRTD